MAEKVINKTLDGTEEEFEFDVRACKFLVKNNTESSIYVSFEPGIDEEHAIEITAEDGYQIVMKNEHKRLITYYIHGEAYKKIYVKGTGDVSVQALSWR